MAEICVFCKEQIETPYPPRLGDNKMFMFEILMEQTSFDKNLFVNSPMCEDCDKTMLDFFNFKSNFMETEDEFINYTNSDNRVDLYDVLVKTYKLKRFSNESVPIKVCRVCFKATQVEDYKEIKSLESSLATMVITCLPEFNIKLTEHTYLCSKCYSVILQYYHFILLCSRVTKSRTNVEFSDPLALDKSEQRASLEISDPLALDKSEQRTGTNISDPLACDKPEERVHSEISDPLMLDDEEPKDKRQRLEDFRSSSESSGPSSPSSLLVPVVPQKRGRGRPRKGEERPKPGVPKKQLKGKVYNTSTSKQNPAPKKDSKPVDAGIDSYECQICPEIFYKLENLTKHMSDHQKETNFFCWKCGFVCYNFGALFKHYTGHGMGLFKTVHIKEKDPAARDSSQKTENVFRNPSKDDKLSKCDNLLSVTSSAVYTPPDLKKKRGRKRKNPLPPSASSASKNTATSYSMLKATKPNVPIAKPKEANQTSTENQCYARILECQICPGAFDSFDGFMKHIGVHKQQSPIACWMCSKRFSSLWFLKYHFSSHGISSLYKIGNSGQKQLSSEQERKLLSLITDTSKTKEPPPSGEPSSDVPCPSCSQRFNGIDSYMTHSCPSEARRTSEPAKGVEEQEFNCGHCSAVFYSLDDLDEHNCIPTTKSSEAKRGGDPLEINRKAISNEVPITTSSDPLALSHNESSTKTTDLDYECSYCPLTFSTLKGLDKHICNGDSENTPTPKPPDLSVAKKITEVKKENVFECSYCISLFESKLELDQHKCSNAPVTEISDSTANTIDGMNQLIKADPEYEDFFDMDSVAEFEKESDKNVSSEHHLKSPEVLKNTEDVLKSRNDVCQKKSGQNKEMSKIDKQKLINNIAEIFGVKIVEGKDKNEDKDSDMKKFICIGCNLKCIDEKDLMFHVGFCKMILRCNFCSYTTDIAQKLEMHSWSFHDMITFVCSACPFVTSMEENYAAHVLSHKDKHNISNDVPCISDTDDVESFALSQLFDFQKFRNGSVSKETDFQRKGVAESGNPNVMIEVPANTQQTQLSNTEEHQDADLSSEETLSADPIWSCDSDDDLEEPAAFHIARPTAEAADNNDLVEEVEALEEIHLPGPVLEADDALVEDVETPLSENDPLATEPVWLVESSSLSAHLGPPEETDGILSPEGSNVEQNQTELIIPDAIISEPSNIEPETIKEPPDLPANNADTNICINCDSESDSEFVESSETRISDVAARAEEVVTISASEATKLISEGVPVITESSLMAMQIETSAGISSERSDAVDSTVDQSPTTLHSNPGIPPQNPEDNQRDKSSGDSSTISADNDKEASENKDGNESTSTDINNLQPETTSQSTGDKEDAMGVSNEENDAVRDNGSKGANDDVSTIDGNNVSSNENNVSSNENTVAAKSTRKVQIIIEREEEAADSDGSSYFVTDNEDSDRDDIKEPKTTSSTSTNVSSIKPQASVASQKKNPAKSSLPVAVDDGVLIIDDDDDDEANINKGGPPQIVTNKSVLGNNKKGCETQTAKSLSPKPQVSSGSKPTKIINGKIGSTNIRIVSNVPSSKSTVSTEESFVISDDEDSPVKEKEPKESTKVVTGTGKVTPSSNVNILSDTCLKKSYLMTQKDPNANPATDGVSRTLKQTGKVTPSSKVKNLNDTREKKSYLMTPKNPNANPAITASSINSEQRESVKKKTPEVKSNTIIASTLTSSNMNMTKRVSVEPSPSLKTPAIATYSRALSNSNKQSENVGKKSMEPKSNTLKDSALEIAKIQCVVIDDDDDDVIGNKEDKTKGPGSKNDSSSSRIVLERDVFQETVGDDSGDDCVLVSESGNAEQSKNLGTTNSSSASIEMGKSTKNTEADKLRAPPNALNLFISKVKNEIRQKYPNLKWGSQKNIIMDAWRGMSDEDKWPFKEEARLHRLLFRRENPELIPEKKMVKKPPPVQKPLIITPVEKIVLD